MNRRPHRGSIAGLTLIEVTVAITLLGLVIAAAVAATGTGLQAWLAAREATALDRRVANWRDQLHATVAAMIPMATVSTPPRPSGDVFFQGTPRGMRFVTAHAPSNGGRGGIRLVEVRSERRDGRIELLLRDAPCPDALALGALLDVPIDAYQPSQANPTLDSGLGRIPARVVADGLSVCEFRYLKNPVGPGESESWVPRWDSREAIPRAVRIDWVAENTVHGAIPGHRASITAAVMSEIRGSRSHAGQR